MTLITPKYFIDHYFVHECRPTKAQVRMWVIGGHLAGRYIGDEIYIDQNAFEAAEVPDREKNKGPSKKIKEDGERTLFVNPITGQSLV